MADEKEFKNLTAGISGIGKDLGAGGKRPPYIQIGKLIGITFSAKNTIPMMRAMIIASNAANPTRDFAEILKKMSVDEPKPSAGKKSSPVVIHTDAVPKVSGEEKKIPDPIAYPVCDVSLLNREALSEQIHAIHNFLRNRGVGYGMSALKVFNLFYGLARIEQYDLFSIIGLDPECKFSKLVSIAQRMDKGDRSDGVDAIYNLTDSFQTKIHSVSMTRKFIMSELPDNVSSDTISRLVLSIDHLLRSEAQIGEQLCGKVYEYFVGRDQTAISEMGAYFTNRSITKFIYEQLVPDLDVEGKVQSMIDPFGGSGGFTTGYVMNLNTRFPNLDWNDGISRVYHFDMNNDVVRYAALELMCLTKALPNMCDSMICENSFSTDRFKQYKYVCTNPPYGGDKIPESISQKARKLLKERLNTELAILRTSIVVNVDKLKKRELQLTQIDKEIRAEDAESDKLKVKTDSILTSQFIKNYARENCLFATESRANCEVLFGNDKEATSLILIAALVAIGGTAIGVLKEGVFFNPKYTILRKHLIEKFNVRKIISIPADQFENTTTKTSIIFFDNDPIKKTSRIEFSELKVTVYEQNEFGEDKNGNLVVIGMKSEFQEVTEYPVSSASLAELQKTVGTKQPFSLDGKQYSMIKVIPGPGYKMMKLGNLCAFMTKSQRPASFGKAEGKYPFYSSSATIKRCDIADYTTEAVIIGNGGSANIAIDKEFSCSDHNYVLQSTIVPIKYIYYILHGNIKLLQDGFHGSVLANLSKSFISDLEIPVLEDSTKMNEWIAKISKAYDDRAIAEEKILAIEEDIIKDVNTIVIQNECDSFAISTICERILPGFNINSGEMDMKGPYEFYNGRSNNPAGTHSKYNCNANSYIILTKDGGSGNGKYGDQIALGKVYLVSGELAVSNANIILKCKDISPEYVYWSLYGQKNKLMDLAKYTIGLGHISASSLDAYTIQVPKNRSVLDEVINKSKQMNTLKHELNIADSIFKKLIADLAKDAIALDTSTIDASALLHQVQPTN